MDKNIDKLIKISLLAALIGILLAGCGLISSPGQSPKEDKQEPPGQVKKTEVEEESGTLEDEEGALPAESYPTPTDEPTSTCTVQPQQVYPVESTPVVITGGEIEEMIAKVKADLASRRGISEDDIVVVSAKAVTWNDSSLGCPKEGGMYLQVLTSGYKIILKVGGVEYPYHTDDSTNFIMCDSISL